MDHIFNSEVASMSKRRVISFDGTKKEHSLLLSRRGTTGTTLEVGKIN